MDNHKIQLVSKDTGKIPLLTSLEELGGTYTLLSAKGGKYEISDHLQATIAIIRNGNGRENNCTVLCTEDADDMTVDSYLNLLINNGNSVKKLKCAKAILKSLYEVKGKSRSIHQQSELENQFNELLEEAVKLDTSDIHIENRPTGTQVKFRINGLLLTHKKWEARYAQEMCSVIYNVISSEQGTNYAPKQPQDAVIDTDVGSTKVRVRLQTAPCFPSYPIQSNDMILRLLVSGKKSGFVPLDKLGYTNEQIKHILKAISRPQGILIISGTTGSGKSTTLKNIMHILGVKNDYKVKMITVEDPVEYEIKNATQVSVNRSKDSKKSEEDDQFANYLRTSLRADPDILMIGEIRDKRTASTACKATLSGHQVLTTLHTGDTFNIISRLIDLGVSPTIIRDSTFISGLINQTLVPILCPSCSHNIKQFIEVQKHKIDRDFLNRIKKVVGKGYYEKLRFRNEKGCSKCQGKTPGVIGRTVIAEVVIPDVDMYNFFAEENLNDARQYWLSALKGMTIQQHGFLKMLKGTIDPRDLEQKTGWLEMQLSNEVDSNSVDNANADLDSHGNIEEKAV